MEYDQDELISILQNNRYHSPEISETDEENSSSKRLIYVYDRSWHFNKVSYLFVLVIYNIYVVPQVTICIRCQLYFFIEGDFHKYESDCIEILGLYIYKYGE